MEISKANGQLDAAFANLGQRASGVHQTYSDIQAGENKSQGGDDGQKRTRFE